MTGDRIKILLVDDDEDDYIVTRDLLSEARELNHELEWVSNFDEALEVISRQDHDVYLLDYRLGERTGLELLHETVGKYSRSPFILLTGQGDHEIDLQAMQAGAADYLVKNEINPPLLERSIRYAIERKHTEEHILHIAYHDGLTGLPNRELFKDRLKQYIAHAERHKKLIAILFLDLDNFKRINDTLGHFVGDRLIKGVAERLNSIMRQSDFMARTCADSLDNSVARLGGDEFTIILSEFQQIEDVARVSQRILETLSRPFILEDRETFITTSIGIAVYPHDGTDMDSLLKNADAAMYQAKTLGKNSFQYYEASINAAALERLVMENDLHKAIERDELSLFYQPLIDIKTGSISSMEALIRWEHPDQGMILPLDFIPIAEETGMIIPIGEWVINTACEQHRAWRDAGMPEVPVSVNVSSHQFQQKDFIEKLSRSLEKTGTDPRSLILDITEKTIMHSTDTTNDVIKELNVLGVRIAVDDFGTSYSSLSYLTQLPIYAIKIDRSFIKNIGNKPNDEAIARAIISMAHSLKLRVIAEGVETEKQLAFVCEQGCNELQGFLFSCPLPAGDALNFMSKEKHGTGICSALLRRAVATIPETV